MIGIAEYLLINERKPLSSSMQTRVGGVVGGAYGPHAVAELVVRRDAAAGGLVDGEVERLGAQRAQRASLHRAVLRRVGP